MHNLNSELSNVHSKIGWLLVIFFISLHTSGQKINPGESEVKSVFKKLTTAHKERKSFKFLTHNYFELYFNADDSSYARLDTILFYSYNNFEIKNCTTSVFTFYDNNLLLCTTQTCYGGLGWTRAFNIYHRKNIFKQRKVFPRYRIYEMNHQTILSIKEDKEDEYKFMVYKIDHTDSVKYILFLQRIRN